MNAFILKSFYFRNLQIQKLRTVISASNRSFGRFNGQPKQHLLYYNGVRCFAPPRARGGPASFTPQNEESRKEEQGDRQEPGEETHPKPTGRQLYNENLKRDMPEIVNLQDREAQADIKSLRAQADKAEVHNNLDDSSPPKATELDEKLTYSQEYYVLNRDELLAKRREKEQEAKFGDYSARLVKRPQKNFLWGYGTQIHDEASMDDDGCFTKGKLPTIKELLTFLEIYQMKDLKVVNLRALGKNEERYAIVCSGFSMRHLYRTAKTLVQKLKALECPEIVNKPTLAGTHDDSWLMVVVKEVQVHMLLDEYRDELDLEFRWMNPPPPEMRKKWKIYERLKRRGQSLVVDEETFKIDGKEEEEYYK